MNLKQELALRKALKATVGSLNEALKYLGSDGQADESALTMLVVVPESACVIPADQPVPLLVWVDQADADVSVTDQDQDLTGESQLDGAYGVFTHLIWLEGLTSKKTYKLTITAQKDGFEDAVVKVVLDRKPRSRARMLGSPPNIRNPSEDQSVQMNFPAWGNTATPNQCPCIAWLVDDNQNTYPGSPIPGQTPPNFGFSFQNIPGGAGQGLHYTLYVQASDGSQTHEDIYVQDFI